MKLKTLEIPNPNPPNLPKRALLITLVLILFTTIPLMILKTSSSSSSLSSPRANPPSQTTTRDDHHHDHDPMAVKRRYKKCDIFSGEWVPNPEGPYYTNETCWAIHEHQNCIKYGRPDTDFMKWRWKPNGCELPIFNPHQFLEIMRDKSLAFVGDSVARNQMQSLICLLSRVEYPYDRSDTSDEHFKRWHYASYNFTLAMYTSTFLVRAAEADPSGPTGTGLFGLHLDEPDPSWASHVERHTHLILSAGHWFHRTLLYYRQGRLIGCRFCRLPNVTDLSIPYGYRAAFRTAFRAILDRNETFRGTVYLRTFAPSHFEGGEWNKGGNCVRKEPFRSSKTFLKGMDMEMYLAQVGEFAAAEREGRGKGVTFRLMDMTQAALLRPDGHPSRFGHWPEEKVVLYNDCVHWCLPGPIDSWNDILLEMVRTEGVASKERGQGWLVAREKKKKMMIR